MTEIADQTIEKPEAKKRTTVSGPVSLFRGKIRAPVSITLTPEHHYKVDRNMRRLGLTRADLIGLLIEKYADDVQRDDR